MRFIGTALDLSNFSSQVTKDCFLFIDELDSQNILSKVIYSCLKNNFGFKTSEELNLYNFREILAAIFKDDVNPDSPHFEKLINGFFHHIYVMQDYNNDFVVPILYKFNNKIYLTISYESCYPPEILSIITQKECPYIFNEINISDDGLEHNLKKYLFKNPDNSEYLLLPTFPAKLTNQIFNFYDMLTMTFKNMTFYEVDEKAADEVSKYLKTIRDFFDLN